MMNLRIIALVLLAMTLVGCSKMPTLDKVIPDKRTAYQKSKDLPALEVPPDLTTTSNDEMSIPADAESTSLTEFERQRALGAAAGDRVVLGTGESEDEQWIALLGTAEDIWPKLAEFWKSEGFELDLNDEELGVMETKWKVRSENNGSERDKFKVFTEAGKSGDTIVYLSSERQESSEGEWLDADPDVDLEKEVIRQLNLHFYGAAAVNKASSSSSLDNSVAKKANRPKTELLSLDTDKIYLAIPHEFTRAWRETELVLKRAGYVVQDSDQEKGTYNFLYFKPKGEEKKGFLSKLKFWSSDEDEGASYQLSLTGVGDKTEVIVMNDKGDWETGDDGKNILETLQKLYNQLK